jgi:undecaprenyl-diphosphatase
MHHLTYIEAIVMGAIQGISELFPISSLGHSILIPALVGGTWAQDLNVGAARSPYLAFIVGLHVATATALLLFFWRDWVRIAIGFGTSLRHRRIRTGAERLAWLLILATIPVGLAGLLLEKLFRTVLGQPLPAAAFLTANGLVLFLGEWLRRRAIAREAIAQESPAHESRTHPVEAASSRTRGLDELPDTDPQRAALTVSDRRVSSMPFGKGILIGATQILALLPGISRSGVVMVGGMAAGLTHREAARFSFLLATPVIFAAGFLKLPDLFGPLGAGIGGQVLAGSVAAFVAALVSVAFLDRYFKTKTLVPFAIYCTVGGIVSFLVLSLR